MTVVALMADPPRPGLVLSELAATSPLSEAEAADLYAAMLKDTMVAVSRSGGDLLVNYRSEELLPEAYRDEEGTAEAEVRTLAVDALDDPDEARFEVQVGSSFDARAGNTVMHLLRDEEVQSAAVVRGDAPFFTRAKLDTLSMQLRTNEVVLGPSTEGRAYVAGFTAPIDFTDAFATPELETLTARANDADNDVAFLEMQSTVRTGADLLTLVPAVRARWQAERLVPGHTAEFVVETGLRVVDDDGEPTLVREE
ncbi:DUF2064 domain-containing protein [Halogeometricum sp. CBA1124]|uniref:TIGR04282 family arsenosugar biosynthesis glycosyltransferase n=1 Tax=Halogeometricum sp. CBA1124 TaxID=2668071 RepID=UPI0014290AB6|nr:DUF2064 domain-containing protein [Halogeometricum sp. CBA1124]MUV57863.1 DUF2064 domain-containing protein [Halogeometricum sp. CBA1124]